MTSTAGPAHRVQSAVVEFGYPQGHLGHLTPEEEAAFRNFKVLCEEKGYYTPASSEHPVPSHDDPLMLRFLRARRFIAPDAFKQFAETEDWRKANQLDELYETIDLEHYDEARSLYPQWTGRRDRRGIPLYVFEVKHLNSKRISEYEKSATSTITPAHADGHASGKLLRLFALYENLTRFTMPLCTQLTDRENPRTPITQSNNIVDISGVGLKQFWNLRTHMQDASTLATAHYPETLDRIFIIGAPSFFPTVWGWCKKWFDPITTSKIFILGQHDMKSTLESFIDPKNIPKKYGGELEFEFGDQPTLDPALADILTWNGDLKAFPDGPKFWRQLPDSNSIEAIAVGSSNGVQRNIEVATLKKVLPEDLERTTTTATQKYGNSLGVPTGTTVGGIHGNPSLTSLADLDNETEAGPRKASVVVQGGQVISSERPEAMSFITATEGLTLTDDEKAIEVIDDSQLMPVPETFDLPETSKSPAPSFPSLKNYESPLATDINHAPESHFDHTNGVSEPSPVVANGTPKTHDLGDKRPETADSKGTDDSGGKGGKTGGLLKKLKNRVKTGL